MKNLVRVVVGILLAATFAACGHSSPPDDVDRIARACNIPVKELAFYDSVERDDPYQGHLDVETYFVIEPSHPVGAGTHRYATVTYRSLNTEVGCPTDAVIIGQ